METSGKIWDAASYDGKHSFVWKHGADLVELLDPKPAERILDLGCGTGHLTNQIAQRCAAVYGIDPSREMIEKARSHYPAITFEIADGRTYRTDLLFDAIFSNAALHWIKPPQQAVQRIAENLRPGGRLVAEFGGKGNIHMIEQALDSALAELSLPPRSETDFNYYPSISEYSLLLEQHGMEVTFATLFDRPTPLEGDECGLRNWLATFRNNTLSRIPAGQREQFLKRIEELAHDGLYTAGGWKADYRRIRIVAFKNPSRTYD